MRAGDRVFHRPSGETWLVASVEEGGEHFYACGWPETRAAVADCDVVRNATDEEHERLLREVAESCGDEGGYSSRASHARQNLKALA